LLAPLHCLSAGAFGVASAQARAEAEAQARAKAEAAAQESERILREERARDAEWRRRALPAPEVGGRE
jgi:hypothetical protein